MSLLIDPEKVTAVLLADGWHDAEDFTIDAYEFFRPHPLYEGEGTVIHGDGAGFSFVVAGTRATIAGPVSSLLAVREEPE